MINTLFEYHGDLTYMHDLKECYYIGYYDNKSYCAVIDKKGKIIMMRCIDDITEEYRLTQSYYISSTGYFFQKTSAIYNFEIFNKKLNIVKICDIRSNTKKILFSNDYVVEEVLDNIDVHDIYIHKRSTDTIIYKISLKCPENDSFYNFDDIIGNNKMSEVITNHTDKYYIQSNISLENNMLTYYTQNKKNKRNEYIQHQCDSTTLQTSSRTLAIKTDAKIFFIYVKDCCYNVAAEFYENIISQKYNVKNIILHNSDNKNVVINKNNDKYFSTKNINDTIKLLNWIFDDLNILNVLCQYNTYTILTIYNDGIYIDDIKIITRHSFRILKG